MQANSHVSQSYAPDHNHNARNAAFTLIELLVVIAIIGILLGILIPSLKKAKEQVRFVLCKSNLKNYGVVANMYISDNRDTMPNAWTSFYNRHEEYPPDDDYPQAEPHRYCRWHNPRFDLTLNPQYAGPFWSYLEMKKVQICPKFVEIARRFGDRHPQHVETIPIVPNYNYAMNQHLGERKITEIRNQSQVFFFSEENLWLTDGWSTYAFNDTALCVIKDAHNDLWDSIQPWDCFGTFHNAKDPDLETGVVNAVFVDGHVQTVHREESQRYAIIDK
ncbi:MAG: prepilin-type N-terminal cleavage/methylation domain-containing protein [Sedimentisphaerales bacterium]|nr:prepilin-type N-terminal cleavage/methylation domain-containing protein [Sedimentisphaerales bacterium]